MTSCLQSEIEHCEELAFACYVVDMVPKPLLNTGILLIGDPDLATNTD